ncbi:hypothetical protein RJ641_014446 [Dillenia turbinata]|uniref:COBRA C-terminal domain-containing protein n=1 Tax=Dillenia turbinata TaxID=194707 RepID=A0AAN8UPF9_9MAGN
MGSTNSSKPEKEPMVPEKGDGFPTKVYFNGEECTHPSQLPSSGECRSHVNMVRVVTLAVMNFLRMTLVWQLSPKGYVSEATNPCQHPHRLKPILSAMATDGTSIEIFKLQKMVDVVDQTSMIIHAFS